MIYFRQLGMMGQTVYSLLINKHKIFKYHTVQILNLLTIIFLFLIYLLRTFASFLFLNFPFPKKLTYLEYL